MTDKYFAKVPNEFKFHDPSFVEKVTKTGKELLVEMLSRYPELETKDCEGISSKVLYRCC